MYVCKYMELVAPKVPYVYISALLYCNKSLRKIIQTESMQNVDFLATDSAA